MKRSEAILGFALTTLGVTVDELIECDEDGDLFRLMVAKEAANREEGEDGS